jgi:hypothetical protein
MISIGKKSRNVRMTIENIARSGNFQAEYEGWPPFAHSSGKLPFVRTNEFHGSSEQAADRSVADKAESDAYFGQGIHGPSLQDGNALAVSFDEVILE